MTDPLELRSELERALTLAAQEAQAYVAGLGDDPVRPRASTSASSGFDRPLPEDGAGAPEAIAELAERGRANGHPVERAALLPLRHGRHHAGGARAPTGSPRPSTRSPSAGRRRPWARGSRRSRCGWLRELFELPPEFGGVLVTGATMANFTGLIAARSWWAERCGFDADEAGLAGAPAPGS